MMLNLFSVFDFYTYYLSNWISSGMGFLFIYQIYWMNKSRLILLITLFFFYLASEFKVILKNFYNLNNLIYFMSLLMFIMFNNFLGLFPYIFTSTSHLVFSMSFSFSMWIGVMIFGWGKNLKFMLAHLLPQGTPFMLMFFMVLIEMLSMVIRPLTLSIRLTANMIAGHLLLVLLASFTTLGNYFVMFFLQLMLLVLEVFVSFIQAYVFTVLMMLYMTETN